MARRIIILGAIACLLGGCKLTTHTKPTLEPPAKLWLPLMASCEVRETVIVCPKPAFEKGLEDTISLWQQASHCYKELEMSNDLAGVDRSQMLGQINHLQSDLDSIWSKWWFWLLAGAATGGLVGVSVGLSK